MMRLASVDPASLACLPDHGSNGAGVGKATTAKSIAACVKATHAAGACATLGIPSLASLDDYVQCLVPTVTPSATVTP